MPTTSTAALSGMAGAEHAASNSLREAGYVLRRAMDVLEQAAADLMRMTD